MSPISKDFHKHIIFLESVAATWPLIKQECSYPHIADENTGALEA